MVMATVVIVGADAILMHSKRSDPSEIDAFLEAWQGRHPVIIVPTKYYQTPTQHWRDLGVSMIIWANHNLRASIAAQQQCSKDIFENESLESVEPVVAPVKEVFRLQNQQELSEAEKMYLPQNSDNDEETPTNSARA